MTDPKKVNKKEKTTTDEQLNAQKQLEAHQLENQQDDVDKVDDENQSDTQLDNQNKEDTPKAKESKNPTSGKKLDKKSDKRKDKKREKTPLKSTDKQGHKRKRGERNLNDDFNYASIVDGKPGVKTSLGAPAGTPDMLRKIQQETQIRSRRHVNRKKKKLIAQLEEVQQQEEELQEEVDGEENSSSGSESDSSSDEESDGYQFSGDEFTFEHDEYNSDEADLNEEDEEGLYSKQWMKVLGPRRELSAEQYASVVNTLKYSNPFMFSNRDVDDITSQMFAITNLITINESARICYRVKTSLRIKLEKRRQKELQKEVWSDEITIEKNIKRKLANVTIQQPLSIRPQSSTLLDDMYKVFRFMDQARITDFADRLFYVRQKLPYHATFVYDQLIKKEKNLEKMKNKEQFLVRLIMAAVTPQVEYEEYEAQFATMKPKEKETMYEFYSRFSALKSFFNMNDKVALNLYAKNIPEHHARNVKMYYNNNQKKSFDEIVGFHLAEKGTAAVKLSYTHIKKRSRDTPTRNVTRGTEYKKRRDYKQQQRFKEQQNQQKPNPFTSEKFNKKKKFKQADETENVREPAKKKLKTSHTKRAKIQAVDVKNHADNESESEELTQYHLHNMDSDSDYDPIDHDDDSMSDSGSDFEDYKARIAAVKVKNTPIAKDNVEDYDATGLPSTPKPNLCKPVFAVAQVNGENHQVMIDSGANTSVISAKLYASLNKNSSVYPILTSESQFDAESANGSNSTGKAVRLHINWYGKKFLHDFFVMENAISHVIFGNDMFPKVGVRVEFPTMTRSQVEKKIGKFKTNPIDVALEENVPNGVEFHERADEFYKRIEKDIARNEKTAQTLSTIGEIGIHFINEQVRFDGGIYARQVPMPDDARMQYVQQIEQWRKDGIVEECYRMIEDADEGTSQNFNTNCFLIHSGKWRFVHNFVPINKVIKDDTNDVPGIDTVFDKVSKSQAVIFSKIDLKSAYLQVPLRRKDRNVTSFFCNGKKFRFRTAPLGLKHIPSTFQRMISGLLQEHGCIDFSCNFLDDIIVFSKTIEEHEKHVKMVLNALSSVDLTIQRKKCFFFVTKVPLLGFWLEKGGLRPNMDKLCNMLEWERPNTRKKVQRFCGIINFFRRFIPNVTELLHPIMSIRDAKFKWTDKMEKAYLKIYQKLVTDLPFLHFPHPDAVIELHTDASALAIGAVVQQKVDGEIRFLGFHSRVLKPNEHAYSIPKKELLSIVTHINYYRHLLLGKFFRLYTDSKSLVHVLDDLGKTTSKNPIIGQWFGTIAEFQFEVMHVPGKDNELPDKLSRIHALSLKPNFLQQVMEEAHGVGHWGASGMEKYIRINYNKLKIKNLHKECLKFCKKCSICRDVNDHRIGYAPIKEPKILLPGEYIHMDLLQMPNSKKGFKYVLVLVDRLSSFVWMRALTSKKKDVVANAALEVFCEFGFPSVIKTDNGTDFVNRSIKRICELAKIKHNMTVAYNHQSNGFVERTIRTIRSTLKKITKDNEDGENSIDNWEEFIPAVALAMNTRVHTGLNATPFSLMFGRGAFNVNNPDSKAGNDVRNDREVMLKFWSTFKDVIAQRILEIRKRRWENVKYGKKTKVYHVNDIVMRRIPRELRTKHEDAYIGPYIVTKVLENGIYEIKRGEELLEQPANYLKHVLLSSDEIEDDLINQNIPIPVYDFEEDPMKFEEGVDDQSDGNYVDEPKLKKKKVSRTDSSTSAPVNNAPVSEVHNQITSRRSTRTTKGMAAPRLIQLCTIRLDPHESTD